jgi:recombination associated protein RdgC
MWFRNLQVYRFPAPWNISASRLEEQLGRHAFRAVTGHEMQTQGWASPREDGGLVHSVHGQMLISLCTEKKLLPASVIKEVTREKAIEAEERQGYKPGRKQLRDLKEQVTDELLPRAFNVRRRTGIWIAPADGWLVIDAGSPGKADEVVTLLNKSVDDFVVERLDTAISPGAAMTAWLANDEVPRAFSIDQDTELQSPVEEKATVRFVRHALDAKEVQRHIAAGKQCTRLALTWADRVSFVLTESLVLKRIAPVDVIREGEDGQAQNDDERFDADFTLMTGELQRLMTDLVEALGGMAPGDRT